MKVLVICQHHHGQLNPLNAAVLQASLKFHQRCDALLIGHQLEPAIKDLIHYPMIEQIITCDQPIYEHQLAENVSQVIAKIGEEYDVILALGSTWAKDILPRASALLGVAMHSDVIEIKSKEIFKRPVYAGNAIKTIKDQQKKKVMSIRATAFEKASIDTKHTAKIVSNSTNISCQKTKFIRSETPESSRPELTAADVVVSGGRGFGSKENFQRLEKLADQLGAAIGASRAAVDAGYVPNDYQVGQTGKIIAPQLYLCFGISGAIQHLAGMKDSKIIIAINKDPEAPIFKVADYHFVGDLFEVLDALEKQLVLPK